MEIAVIEKIKRLPQQTEESLRDAFSVLTKHKKSLCQAAEALNYDLYFFNFNVFS